MKEKVKLIQGDPDRAEEIRKTLEEWGGINSYKLKCTEESQYYFIDNLYMISSVRDSYIQKLIAEGKAEIYELPKQQTEYEFKPFEKVLVRDYDYKEWRCDFFSHILKDGEYSCIGKSWKKCIPYEGNEYLLGTNLLGTTGKPNQ